MAASTHPDAAAIGSRRTTQQAAGEPLMSAKELHRRMNRVASQLSRAAYIEHQRLIKAELMQIARQGGDVPLALAEMELGALQPKAAGILEMSRALTSTLNAQRQSTRDARAPARKRAATTKGE